MPPLRSDRTSAATAINSKGQVVDLGACGPAIGGVSAAHAVMRDEGGEDPSRQSRRRRVEHADGVE